MRTTPAVGRKSSPGLPWAFLAPSFSPCCVFPNVGMLIAGGGSKSGNTRHALMRECQPWGVGESVYIQAHEGFAQPSPAD